MSDKKKNFAIPSAPTSKTAKIKRPSTVKGGIASSSSTSSTSRPKTGATTASKEKVSVSQPRSKFNKNTTTIGGEADTTVIGKECFPSFDAEYRQVAYGNYLRAMLEDCMVDEKIEREETYMDIQMTNLADRFQKTTKLLDNTNKRVKDMSFVVEQKRLLDMKNQDCSSFYETSDSSNVHNILLNLSNTQQTSLDKLHTKNVDFGFNKNSGHQQLLDAVNDAIEGLEQIKKHSNLDLEKFNEYKKSQNTWMEVEKERFDLESLKHDFDVDFPKFNERLLKEATEKIASMIENEEE